MTESVSDIMDSNKYFPDEKVTQYCKLPAIGFESGPRVLNVLGQSCHLYTRSSQAEWLRLPGSLSTMMIWFPSQGRQRVTKSEALIG
jgi:hypothetical protein